YTAILRAGSGRLPRGTRRWLLAGAGLALLHLAATPFAHPTLVVPGAIMLWLLVFPAIVVALPHWEGFTPPQRRLGSMVAVMVFALACVKGAATLLPWLPAVVSGDGMLRLIFAVAAGGLMALLLMQVAELFRSNRAALEATAAAARKEAELNEALYTSERDYAEAMRKASGLRRRLEVTAHDIRQPLSALRHFLGRSAGAEEERQAMEEALDYLEGLAGPAPDVEAPAEPDAEPYRVDVVLSAVKQMLREEADTRAIDLSITAPPEATTITPALTLMRIVSNLAVNAIKHSGGSYVRLGATVAEGRTTVSVRNDGAVLSRPAFERYLGSGVKGAASEGDGLGLSIVADLSRAAGLDLSLDTSNPAETAIVVGLTPA
ncbi:MAG: HAMP domain-containing sensor histidine kinase, partial [Pseudomonadota bacterium]